MYLAASSITSVWKKIEIYFDLAILIFSAKGRIQTHNLWIVSGVVYHCAPTSQPIKMDLGLI